MPGHHEYDHQDARPMTKFQEAYWENQARRKKADDELCERLGVNTKVQWIPVPKFGKPQD